MADEKEKEKEREEIEKIRKDKERQRPWWQEINPAVLAGLVLVGLFMFKGILEDTVNKNNVMFWVIAIVVVIYLLSKAPAAKDESIVSPREAELLVIRECERKKRWGQFRRMAKFDIGPVGPLQRKDGGGMYYDIPVEVTDPYDPPRYFVAVVMARGLEKTFTTFIESIGPISGREKVSERTVIPQWMIDAKR